MGAVTAGQRVDWPEQKPIPWRLLARLDQVTPLSSLLGNRLDVILLYHSVGGISGTSYDYDLPEAQFRKQMQLVNERFDPVDLETLLEKGAQGGRKRVAVTFDDGFRNVHDVAAPILREFDIPATVFVCPDLLNDADIERIRKYHSLGPNAHEVLMTEQQVQSLAADELFVIGNHTANHVRVTDLDADEIANEVIGAKHDLERLIGSTVDRFSYPYGIEDSRTAEAVIESHSLAVTSERALLGASVNPYRLSRIDACQPFNTFKFEMSDISHHIRQAAHRTKDVL